MIATAPTQRPSTVRMRATLLADALAVMEADFGADLGIDDIARKIATSRRQLQRCFAEHGEGSYRECLTRIRMRRAAQLLAETSFTVGRISHHVGYKQQAQFAKAFRRYYGAAPAEYRAATTSYAVAA